MVARWTDLACVNERKDKRAKSNGTPSDGFNLPNKWGAVESFFTGVFAMILEKIQCSLNL